MAKLLFCISAFLLSVSLLYAQNVKETNGIIKGTITTSDGKPAINVTVRVENAKWGDVTNEKGAYTIRNVKPGNWTLKVSSVATIEQRREVTVTSGQTQDVDFSLNESSAQLHEIIVSSRNLNKENNVVAKMPLKNLENPQVYNTVSAELMKQQAITSYDDALRNVPGITRTWESTGRAGDGGSYFALRGFDAQPTLYNGLPGITSGNVDPADVEEIQVLKGPSGTLFGGSFYSYGGIINTITKRPYYDFGGEVAYNLGSYGLNRVTADINAPLSKKDKIAMRINTAYHTENSFQDAGFKKSFFIAPSFVYEVNDRLSFHFLVEIMQEERAVPPVFFHNDRESELRFKSLDELRLNPYLSFTSNDLTIKNPRYNMQGQIVYKLSDKWTSQTSITRGNTKSDGYYLYIWDFNRGDDYFDEVFFKELQTTNTTNIQQNFNGDFMLGNLRNRLVAGLDFYSRTVIDNGSGLGFIRNVAPWGGDPTYIDPFSGEDVGFRDLSKASLDNAVANTGTNNSNFTNNSYGAYVSDVLNITPNLLAMASLRADYYDSRGDKNVEDDSYHQFALSPKFGLVYQPIPDKLSLFGSYMNAFINVDPRQIYDDEGNVTGIQSFKPEHANQWEFGVKANVFSDKLFATVSVYDIKVTDRVVDVTPTESQQIGRVHSKGLEVDINANPFRGLNLIAGYAYNQIKNLKGAHNFYAEEGRAPGGQGPQNLANFWATYKIPAGKLKNFGIGLGGNYGSEYKVIDNSVTGVFTLPGYALVNTSLFYAGEKVRITMNVNNVTSKEYYTGYWSVNPQKQRNYTASLSYRF